MTFRLPPPWGSRIDRSSAFDFVFEGRTYAAYPGDTIASALAAAARGFCLDPSSITGRVES